MTREALRPAVGALPNLVVIGAMKCGTSALHRYLDTHPDIAMSDPKELNFFVAPPDGDGHRTSGEGWAANWHRGVSWYAGHFPAGAPVRGESSPGYTSPDHPGVAERMAALLPDARLIYLVRDPIARAVSQYRHHAADGVEARPADVALVDPSSQYIARGRYYERLEPFLTRFAPDRIAIVAQEEFLTDRRRTLEGLFRFVGVDDGWWSGELDRRWHTAEGDEPELSGGVRELLAERFRDDVDRLRCFAGRDFPRWTV